MLSGWKTYIVAALMLVHAVSGYFLGTGDAVTLNIQEVLTALGLATLRAGISATATK